VTGPGQGELGPPGAPVGPIRVGLIGFGLAARTFHLPLLRATPGYRLVAVASTRAAELAAALPDVEPVEDYAALASHPGVDLVVVATPNDTHAPLAEAALLAGRHVVVDKPFTVTLAEARRLDRVADEQGRLLSVFHNRRWDGDFLTVREAIRRGLAGEVVRFESRFDRFRPEVRDRWRERPGPGSGVLYDLGPHLIDQALLLFGPPDTVQATLAVQRAAAATTDFFHLVLRYGRRVAILEAGSLVAGGSARFTVHGERATLVKRGSDVQEDQLRAGVAPGSEGWGADPDGLTIHDGATGQARTLPALPGDQRGYYLALREALAGRAPNPVPPAQGAAVMALLEAALRSETEGCRITPDLRNDERDTWQAFR
jgi:predicted dehydrogenase